MLKQSTLPRRSAQEKIHNSCWTQSGISSAREEEIQYSQTQMEYDHHPLPTESRETRQQQHVMEIECGSPTCERVSSAREREREPPRSSLLCDKIRNASFFIEAQTEKHKEMISNNPALCCCPC
jgi:hypothetical protein